VCGTDLFVLKLANSILTGNLLLNHKNMMKDLEKAPQLGPLAAPAPQKGKALNVESDLNMLSTISLSSGKRQTT